MDAVHTIRQDYWNQYVPGLLSALHKLSDGYECIRAEASTTRTAHDILITNWSESPVGVGFQAQNFDIPLDLPGEPCNNYRRPYGTSLGV